MGGPAHLARRFFGSLHPGRPAPADVAWVGDHLSEAELAIWSAMSAPDQRHSIQVARDADGEVSRRDNESTGSSDGAANGDWAVVEGWFESAEHRRRTVVAAALLHDSGKNQSGLGTFARVGATLLRPFISDGRRRQWHHGDGFTNRLSRYWSHPELGAQSLRRSDSHRLVASWAAEHHSPIEKWTIPAEIGVILRDCDDD